MHQHNFPISDTVKPKTPLHVELLNHVPEDQNLKFKAYWIKIQWQFSIYDST